MNRFIEELNKSDKELRSLSKEEIIESITGTEVLGEAFVNLYKAVFPEWDKIETLGHFPKINMETLEFILGHMRSVFPANTSLSMIWVNQGFGNNDSVPSWHVEIIPSKIKYIP